MFKRNNQFPQPIRPAMSDRQVRSPIGHFAGEAWAVREPVPHLPVSARARMGFA